MFAALIAGRLANFASSQVIVSSTGRPYIQEIRPSAKRFLVRCASAGLSPSMSSVARVGQRRHRHAEGLVVVDRAVLERVGLVPGLAQVGVGEGVLVDDQRAAGLERAEVRFQRRRVHRHQRVRVVARGEDVARGEVDLEGGDAARGPGRGADLGREVGQRREVVADMGGGGGEPAADQLHAVARVPREPDDYPLLLIG